MNLVYVSWVGCGLDMMIDFTFQRIVGAGMGRMNKSYAIPQSQQMAHCANRISSQVQGFLMSINYQIVVHQSALVSASCCSVAAECQ